MTRAIAAEYRLAHWARIIQEREESGLSIRAFCENSGFHKNIYFYWQRKLRATACGQIAGKEPETAIMPRVFTEVRLSEPAGMPYRPERGGGGGLHIEVGGMRITADSEYAPTKLAELIKGIMSPC